MVICAYDLSKPRCACTYDVIQDGAEETDERETKLAKAHPTHMIPKIINCILLMSNANRKDCLERGIHTL